MWMGGQERDRHQQFASRKSTRSRVSERPQRSTWLRRREAAAAVDAGVGEGVAPLRDVSEDLR